MLSSPSRLLRRFMALPSTLSSRGFTLVEVLVVIALMTGLLTIGIPISWDFYTSYQFDSELQTFVSILEQARNFSMVNRYESPHGVLVDANQFVIFQGNSYVTRNPIQDLTFPRNGTVTITGPDELVFTSLSGTTTASTYTFVSQHRNVVISVNYHGAILYQ